MRQKPLNRMALYTLLAIAWTGTVDAKTCNITSGAVAFGAYNPTSSASLDTTGSLDLRCTGAFQAVLSLSLGNGAGATYADGLKMTRGDGVGTLTYKLYADAGRTQVFGDGTGGSVTLQISGINSYVQAIWARILGGQYRVPPGIYTDCVVATIFY